jgi:hypothetical protein
VKKLIGLALELPAVAIGIRPAARQAAQDLPPDEQERFVQRAMKRCSREKWLVKSQQDKANAIAKSPTALSADVRKGSDVLNEALAEDSRATRLGLSAAAPQSTDLRPREKEIAATVFVVPIGQSDCQSLLLGFWNLSLVACLHCF